MPNRDDRTRLALCVCLISLALMGLGCDTAPSDQVISELKPANSPNFVLVGNTKPRVDDAPVFDAERAIKNSIIIGLDTDMSSGSGQSGESIRRGVVLAIEQINAGGGLLGRSLELIVRDHRGNPDRGIDNIDEFSKMDDLVAIVGGLHTPVALRELDLIHERQIIYLGPWAAGTSIVDNGYSPNFVFRVSVRDEFAGGFLVQSALDRDLTKLGLLLERTAWGRSNAKAMSDALESHGLTAAEVEWFNWGEKDFETHLDRLADAGAQAIILVCNSLEGSATVAAMAARPEAERLPIISHWGITGADFAELSAESLPSVDLSFLQTHSFIEPRRTAHSDKLYDAYTGRFSECKSPRDIFSPAGTTHAYEIVMILAAAVERAGTIESLAVRAAMEEPISHAGVIRNYDPPFQPGRHDALSAVDFVLARYSPDGAIVPIAAKQN